MFKKILVATISLIIVPIAPLLAIQSLSISLNQEQFKPGEKVEAKIVFTNVYQKEILGYLTCNFSEVSRTLPPMPQREEFSLKSGEKTKPFFCSMVIGETMPAGWYRAEVEARDQNDNLMVASYKDFLVTKTKKEIGAELLICADIDCKNSKSVFIKGETVYLKLDTGLILKIDATLKKPDGQEGNIEFKNNKAQFRVEKEGGYELKVNLNEEGYQEEVIVKNFAVIDAPAKIQSTSICNADGLCSGQENAQNCPQDCLAKKKVLSAKIIILIAALVMVISVIVAAYYFLARRREI